MNSMDRYRKAFLVLAIVVSLQSLFLIIVGLVTLSFGPLTINGAIIILWLGMYFYLRDGSKLSFWFSFILVNLFWWPLLFKSIRRVSYVIGSGGFDFPRSFLISAARDLIFFVLLTIALIFGVLVFVNPPGGRERKSKIKN